MSTNPTGFCLDHADRSGVPCLRCGTFRCDTCLVHGLCPRCSATRAHPPSEDDAVGFGRRLAARLIDLLVQRAVSFAAGLVAGITLATLAKLGLVAEGWMFRFNQGVAFHAAVGLVAIIGGNTMGVWLCGTSVGKLALGMRVVTEEGNRIGPGAAAIREAAYFIDAFLFGMVAKFAMDGSPLCQRMGDDWAGTVIVRSSSITGPVSASSPRIIIGLMAGLGFQLSIVAAANVISAW